ncbi:MAG: hypothetical protein ACFFDW_01900 [Candidatus Thorarchaeota archaeon]
MYFSIQGIISFLVVLLGGIISDVLVLHFDYFIMAIVLYLIGGVGQFLMAFGFLFLDESFNITKD